MFFLGVMDMFDSPSSSSVNSSSGSSSSNGSNYDPYASLGSSSSSYDSNSSSSNSSDPYSSASTPSINSVGSFNPKKTLVLSIGGSIFFPNGPDVERIRAFCLTLNELIAEGYGFVIVVGGGGIARNYIECAKSIGANYYELDKLGIDCTVLNARFLSYYISNAWPFVLTRSEDSRMVLSLGRTPFFGGTIPGQTTDAVGASLAEYLECDFCNISNVNGIYSADPNKNKKAQFISHMGFSKMISLLKKTASEPGAHTFVDPHAAQIISRSKIRSFFINGNNLENFKALVRGQDFEGSIVSAEFEG